MFCKLFNILASIWDYINKIIIYTKNFGQYILLMFNGLLKILENKIFLLILRSIKNKF